MQKREVEAAYGGSKEPLPTLAEQIGLDWVGERLVRAYDEPKEYASMPVPGGAHCASAVLFFADYVEDVAYTFEDCDTFAIYGMDWMQ